MDNAEETLRQDIDDLVEEAYELGLNAIDIDKMVQESIAWITLELEKDEV